MIDQAEKLRAAASHRSGAATSRPLRDRRAGLQARVIAVCSGKGGVGKSNVALFLASALTMLNKKVAILDADLGLANIHILTGISPQYNLSHVVSGQCTVSDIIVEGPGGADLIPGASGLQAMARLDSIALETLVRSLEPIENTYDFLILDIGAGIGDAAIRITSHADQAIVVLTPEPTSLADAYATVKLLSAQGLKRIAILVNMATSEKEGMEAFSRIESLVKKFLTSSVQCAGILPADKDVPRMVRQQKNVFVEKPRSELSRRIAALARRLCGIPAAQNTGFFARFLERV